MDCPFAEVHFGRFGELGVEQQMSRYTALGWILAAGLSSPLAAKSESMPAPVAAADISGASSVAAGYGVVTSTYRSVEHNRAVGGVVNSYHLSGRAIDVARKRGVTHGQIAAALQRAGYVMVESLDEGDHSHFAFALLKSAAGGATLQLASRKPAAPAKPAPPAILADEHGALLIDLAAAGPQAAQTTLPSTSGVRIPPGTAARD
jgi:Peptidase M15